MESSSCRTGSGRAARVGAIVLALGAFGGARGGGDDESTATVQVLLSSRESPYWEAWEEIVAALDDERWEVGLSVVGSDVEDEARRPAASPDAYLALGAEALRWADEHGSRRARLFYCLVATGGPREREPGPSPLGISPEVPLKEQFRLIREALPAASVVGILYQDKGGSIVDAVRAALPEGLRVEGRCVKEPEEFARTMHDLLESGVDILWIPPQFDLYTSATVRSLILAALRRGTPVFGFSESVVKAGALLGVNVDPREQGRQAADLLERYRKELAPLAERPTSGEDGAPSPDIEAPRYQVVVNLFAARQLGVTLPESILARANRVLRTEE